MTISKDDFDALLKRYEACGMLPKGKRADLIESFDFVTAEAKAESDGRITSEFAPVGLRDDERTTDPEVEPVSKKRSK